MLNKDSVSSFESATDNLSIVEHARVADNTSCLVCGEIARNGFYLKCSKCTLSIHYLCNDEGVSNYYRKKPKNFKCYICKPNK